MSALSKNTSELTEAEYWHDYGIIRDDVYAAMMSCYTHRAVNHIAATDKDILEKMNRNPEFWLVNSFSLQNTLFIVLARILDDRSDVHSIHHVLNATTGHPEFFSKVALRARRLSISNAPLDMELLDESIQNAWEPTIRDLRVIKKALAPHKTKFDEVCKPIRHQIAHIILKDETLIAHLYSQTQKKDIDEILCFLHSVVCAIWEIAFNGRPPDLRGDNYGYAARVADISHKAEKLLRQLK